MIWLILLSLFTNQCPIIIIRFRCIHVDVLIVKLGGKLPSKNMLMLLPLWCPFPKIWSCFCLYLYTDMTRFVYFMTYAKATNIYPETTTSAAENSSTTNDPPTGKQSDTPLKYPSFCLFFYACMNLILHVCILVIWPMAKQQILIQRQLPQLLRIHQQPTTHQQVCTSVKIVSPIHCC